MPAAVHPRASFRGVVTCVRAAAMLVAARDLLISWGHSYIADGLWLTQGSYRPASTFSSRTHCGCGVVDIGNGHRITGRAWTAAEWEVIVKAARAVGFFAAHRGPWQVSTWPHHVHAVAGNCPELDPEARAQWTDYLAGGNGLTGKSHGRDDGPRESVGMTWEKYLEQQAAASAAPTQEEDMSTFMTVLGDRTGAVYISDGITARHVPGEQVLADLGTLANEGLLKVVQPAPGPTVITVAGVRVRVVRSLDVVGKVI